ncbi:hypothetical protein JCM8547_001827, partial [Rhodosporidiobolus lusitaniae]
MTARQRRPASAQPTGEDQDPRPLKDMSSSSGHASAGNEVERVDKGRWRSGLEIPRKLLHSSIALVVTYLWTSHMPVPKVLRVLGWATVVIGGADLARFQSRWFEKVYEGALGYFMRESERHAVNGTLYYLIGVLICLSFYPRDIAVLSVIQLSLCDTTASVFGRLFGRYTPKLPFAGTLFGAKKSLAGTVAAVVTGTAASYVFWTRFAAWGDEGDVSWLPARFESKWRGAVMRDPWEHYGVGRLPNPQ